MRAFGSEKTPRSRGLFFSGWRRPATILCVLLLCIAPFLPGLDGPFQLDDTINLERVHVDEASLGSIYHAAFSNSSGVLGRPLSNLTFVANQLAFGYEPFGYKLVNLGLHLAVGILVFLLCYRLIALFAPGTDDRRRTWIALGAAALWTIHPLQASTALYVVQRMTQLSALFMLLAVNLALWMLMRPGGIDRRIDGIRGVFVIGLVALLAVLSKENGVLVPFLLLAIRLSLPRAAATDLTRTPGQRAFWALGAYVPAVLAAVAVLAAWEWLVGGYAMRHFSLAERLVTQPVVLAGYLKSFFLPDLRAMGLFLDGSPVVSADSAMSWAMAALVPLAAIAAVLVKYRFPVVSFATLWFIASHLLESTFLPLELAFEHRNYVALVGPCLLLATGVARLERVLRRRAVVLVAAAVLLVLGGLTYLRAATWSNHTTFVSSELEHHPESMRAQIEAVALESSLGNHQAAVRRVSDLQRTYPDAFFPIAMDMDIACIDPSYVADWDSVLERIRATPSDLDITTFHKTIALKIIRGECGEAMARRYSRHIERVTRVYRDIGMPMREQFFLMIQADLHDDPDATRELLRSAIDAAPGSPEPLVRLAYFELNAGRPRAADAAIERLSRSIDWWEPEAATVRELRAHLDDLREKMGDRASP